MKRRKLRRSEYAHRVTRRRWRSSLSLIRDSLADERVTLQRKRLEIAVYTATINLLVAQRGEARRSIHRATARMKRLHRDQRRGVRMILRHRK